MSSQAPKLLSYTDAAERVLKESDKREAMHYQTIINIATSKGWIAPQGLTPGASLTSMISQENRRREERGELPRFSIKGRGFYGLSEWQQNTSTIDARHHIRHVQEQLVTHLRKMPPYKFEEVIAILLSEMGFINVERKGGTGDRGIDIIADLKVQEFGTVSTIVQVKRYTSNLGPEIVRNLAGAFTKDNPANYGLLITTANFTSEAKKAAEQSRVSIWLVDGTELARLMIQYKIGVRERQITTYEIDDSFFIPPVNEEHDIVEELVVVENISTLPKPKMAPKVTIPEGLIITANVRGGRVVEAITGKANHVIYNGVEYSSPSIAGANATGWKSCNGWTFWRYQDIDSGDWVALDELRKTAEQQG